jgi:DNA polymerase III epsilon subunit-like protein
MQNKQQQITKGGAIPNLALCIDWETTGSNFGGDSSLEYQGIAFGAVIFRLSDFEVVDTLKRYVKYEPAKYKWSADAQRIHGMTRGFLEENGITQEEAAADLAELIIKYFGPSPKIMVLGHNVGFDISFTRQLLQPHGLMFDVHHVLLDTSGMGLIAFGKYKSDHLFELVGLEKRGNHDPLEDALYTLEVVKSVRLLVNEALGNV